MFEIDYIEDANDIAVTVHNDDEHIILTLANSKNQWMDIKLTYLQFLKVAGLAFTGMFGTVEICDEWLSELNLFDEEVNE